MSLVKIYKKSNKERRKKIILDAGFKDANSYLKAIAKESDDISKIRKISKTNIVKLIEDNAYTPISVHYNKMADLSDIKKELYKLYSKVGKINSEEEYQKAVDKCVNIEGEERTLTGLYMGEKDHFGRFAFNEGGHYKLVDSRTLKWCVINDTKFIKK